MEDDEINPEDIEEPEGDIEPLEYNDLVTEEPEREIDIEDFDAPKSVTEAEEEAPQLSDLKAVLCSLSPKFKVSRVNDLVQSAMVSRVPPDNLLDKQKIIVLSLVEEYNEDDAEIPVIDIIMNVQDALLIGLEGRGIVERLEIAGVAHEEEMEKIARDLGI